jgi:O-antigen biosynthesis protein
LSARELEYTGERLVPGDERLSRLLVEDLAKFHFASQYTEGKYVLDAGCGAGQGSAHMASEGARQVIGMDLAVEAVRFAGHYYPESNLAFAAVDAQRLAFTAGSFDCVTSIEVIEHLPDPERYVAEIRRVIRDGGRLVLSTPNKLITSPTPGTLYRYHLREFYPDELRSLLGKYFAEVELWGVGIPVYDQHVVRRAMHLLAPIFKPILPHRLRVSAVATVHGRIKSDLTMDDVVIAREDYALKSTLLAVCRA